MVRQWSDGQKSRNSLQWGVRYSDMPEKERFQNGTVSVQFVMLDCSFCCKLIQLTTTRMSFWGILFLRNFSFDFKLKQLDICIDYDHIVSWLFFVALRLFPRLRGRSYRNTILELQECCKHAQNKSKHCASVTGILAMTKKKPEKKRTRPTWWALNS